MGGKKYNKDGSKKEQDKQQGKPQKANSGVSEPQKTPSQSTSQQKPNQNVKLEQASGSQQQPKVPAEQQKQKQQSTIQEPIQAAQAKDSQGARPKDTNLKAFDQTKKERGMKTGHADKPKEQPKNVPKQPVESEGALGGPQPSTSASSEKPQHQTQAQEKAPKVDKEVEKLFVDYKGPGKRGRKIGNIETNYLALIISKVIDNVYHYDVKFEPDKPKKLLTAVFLKFARVNFPTVSLAFDGKNNAYATERLKIGDFQQEIKIIDPLTGGERNYVVSIQEANDSEIPIKNALTKYQGNRMSDDPKRALQAIEVILKAAFNQPHLEKGIQGGRSFFSPPDGRRVYLGDFYELWLGLFQSVVLGNIPLLNVDVSHKAFPKRYNSLIDLLRDMEQDMRINIDFNRPLDRRIEENLKEHLKGLDICYTTPGTANKRIYKFMAIDRNPSNVTFNQNGVRTTVLQYFQNSGRVIRYPAMPCIKLGNTIKNQSVPMEFCSIPDTQVVNKKCTEKQTSKMIREAATSTGERKTKIMDQINQIQHNQSQTLKGFGLSVDVAADFYQVPARKLDAPNIKYANNVSVKPFKGAWRMDVRKGNQIENCQFLIPGSAIKWGILNANCGRYQATTPDQLQRLARALVQCNNNGVKLEGMPSYIKHSIDMRNPDNLRREFKTIVEQGIVILFCVIPDKGSEYADIKQCAEFDFCVLTQCIKGGTVFNKIAQRLDLSTVSNILVKVNAKLNGTNHMLESTPILPGKKIMIVGADVTHPSQGENDIPSIVGSAASYDPYAFRYNICWRMQRKEMIMEFKDIIIEHLKFYKMKNNNALPEEILYYRDGVSESQFDQVMAIEFDQMKQACREIKPGYENTVKITIIIVQKRHHTRFFPLKEDQQAGDKNKNLAPGTIVDTGITRPRENHFYLLSHQAIQGVARPTKYCILLDQANHSIDDLQALSYNLCHMYARCNRSVSYPAPTYYAHWVAYRCRVLIKGQRLNMDDLHNEWSKRNDALLEIIRKHPMFFI